MEHNRLYNLTTLDALEKKTLQTRIKDIVDIYIEDAPVQLSVDLTSFIEEYLKNKAIDAIEKDIESQTGIKTGHIKKGLINRSG